MLTHRQDCRVNKQDIWSELHEALELACATRGGAKAIADATGMHPAQVSRFRRSSAAPSMDSLERLAPALGYDLRMDLVGRSSGEKMGPPPQPSEAGTEVLWARLRRLLAPRIERHGAKAALAQRVGVSPQQISKYFSLTQTPPIEVLDRLARELGFRVHLDLVADRPDSELFIQAMHQLTAVSERDQDALLAVVRGINGASPTTLAVVRSHLAAAARALRYGDAVPEVDHERDGRRERG